MEGQLRDVVPQSPATVTCLCSETPRQTRGITGHWPVHVLSRPLEQVRVLTQNHAQKFSAKQTGLRGSGIDRVIARLAESLECILSTT